MESRQVIKNIKREAARILPKGSSLYLYGSRARGKTREDSDWDLLLLLDTPQINWQEREKLEISFVEMGWSIGEDISARAYTKTQWFNSPHSLFFYNVEEDKKLLYES